MPAETRIQTQSEVEEKMVDLPESGSEVEVEIADGKLTIRSVKESDAEDDGTIHRGISYRKFSRQFTLADDIVVNGASLNNGLLTVTLEQIVPEEKKPRLIEVK